MRMRRRIYRSAQTRRQTGIFSSLSSCSCSCFSSVTMTLYIPSPVLRVPNHICSSRVPNLALIGEGWWDRSRWISEFCRRNRGISAEFPSAGVNHAGRKLAGKQRSSVHLRVPNLTLIGEWSGHSCTPDRISKRWSTLQYFGGISVRMNRSR